MAMNSLEPPRLQTRGTNTVMKQDYENKSEKPGVPRTQTVGHAFGSVFLHVARKR